MPPSTWPWAIAAGFALAGGAVALRSTASAAPVPAGAERWASRRRLTLWLTILALLAAAAGLAWRAWEAACWPGAAPADALALLAGGGLVVIAWLASGRDERGPAMPRGIASSIALFATAVLLGAAVALAQASPAVSLALPARTWLFGLRNLLAGIGLGGWLPALTASAAWYARTAAATVQATPATQPAPADGAPAAPVSLPAAPAMAHPAEDPGRCAALLSFPWLTAACLVSGAWNLIAHAALGRAAPADLWLLAAWLLAAAYLHVTSSWRPLRLPGWLAPLLAAATLAAGLSAASTAASLR